MEVDDLKAKETELYPIDKVLDIFKKTREMRVNNYLMSKAELNTQIKKEYVKEFKAYYDFNYDIVKRHDFYINILNKSYEILLKIIEIDHINTFKNFQIKQKLLDEFLISLRMLYWCTIFKKKKKLF